MVLGSLSRLMAGTPLYFFIDFVSKVLESGKSSSSLEKAGKKLFFGKMDFEGNF